MSRPNESEPSRKTCLMVSPSSVMISPACPGSRSRLAASKSEGSTVTSQGACVASRIRTSGALPPIRTDQFCRILLIADPGVEQHVGEVDQQVDADVDH